jgi:hypothetical protein
MFIEILANMIQVSGVAPGPLVSYEYSYIKTPNKIDMIKNELLKYNNWGVFKVLNFQEHAF